MKMTAFIVPAWSDQAGQCRIVAREGSVAKARLDYLADPDAWREIGIMNSQGKLVCLEALGDLAQQMKDCEPMMAGLQFEVDIETEAA